MIYGWRLISYPSVNTNKTNYILFKGKDKKTHKNISIIFDKTKLVQKQSTKFLGVVIDENLSWKLHISYICKKISKSTRIIFRCRYYLSTKTKLSLYYTLVYSYLTYCNIVWSSNYKTNLKRIYLLQKRIVRALKNLDYHAHLCKTNTKQFTIRFQGPKIWNSLPNDILKTETLSYLRSRMLNFLLES